MIAAAIPEAVHFPAERRALHAAWDTFPGSPVLVTKKPRDVEKLDQIRSHYRRRKTSPTFLVTVRDPRDVAVSSHDGFSGEYYVSLARIIATGRVIGSLVEAGSSDIAVVRFEDLVLDTAAVERQLQLTIGFSGSLSEYQTNDVDWEPSLQASLGGLRPVDPSRIGVWKSPRHRDRIAQAANTPGFPELVRRLGYGGSGDGDWS